MNQGEFYGSNEYNSISEYKHFPAEMYIKPNEENLSGNELADLGREITTLQSKSKIAKKSGALGKPFEYIFNSLRGVATLATAAASLLIMTTALVTGTPDAELVKVECGDTYIEYEMEVSGLDADGEYAIVLSTTDEEDVEMELDGDGTYSDRIDGLKSEWEYKLALVQYDSVLGEIYHFEVKLQTLKHRDQDPIPPTEDEPESHIHNFVEGVCDCGEVDPNYVPPHTHNFVEGVCDCGEVDPNYVPPHTHNFIEGVCDCGERDPNYVPPHTHNFVEGVCDCGERDPNYVPPHTHNFVEGVCDCGEVDPNYVPPHTHNFVEGVCGCGEVDPNYVPPHTHNFVEGVCDCGEVDPNYVPPHTHNFVEGVCECGERDPNYVPPHTHNFVEGVCDCGEVDPNYVPDPIPNITVSGVEIVGLNKINVYFTHSDISDGDVAEFEILADDFGGFRMPIYDEDLVRGYVTVDTEDMQISNTLTIKPYVTEIQDNERVVVECEEYSHIFEETFSVEVMVGLKNEMITFYPSGLAYGADSIHITSSLNPEEPTVEWLDDVVRIWYDSYDVITYTMYLTNENGDILSNEVEITVNTSVSVPDYEYNIHSVNPGEVGITYNDDGTINMYIQNNFEANSEDVYYQITVGNIRYKSREPLAKLEGIADESYALSYDVCVDIDGVQYSIFNTVPSGVANESYIYYESEFSNNVLMLSLYKDSTGLDLNSVRLVSSAGEEILLSESDFVYNEEYNSYDISVTLNEYAESVEIYMMANPYIGGLADVSDYIGNERKIFVETVYQP